MYTFSQIEDIKTKLEEAERRALENLELVSAKDTSYEKQVTFGV